MSSRMAFWLAVAVSALTIAFAVRMNTFTPWGTDAAAYIEEAHRWEKGALFTPLPLQLWAPWAPSDWVVAPHGFRPGVERGTEVGQYPLGLPVLMAAAIELVGPLGAYLVVPLTAGLLVWCVYQLGSALAGPWSGLLAAVVMAASPITLVSAVQPMSDVPAAAFWILAWVMGLRPGMGAAAAAGAATAVAVMIRPNLAPLSLIVAGVVLGSRAAEATSGKAALARMAAFSSLAAVGPVLVAWSHHVLYDGILRSGYLAQDYLFNLAHVPESLGLYPRLVMRGHTPIIFLGFVAAFFVGWSPIRSRLSPSARRVIMSAVALASVNYLLYLPYVPLPDPEVVRFVLPAFGALTVLFAGALVHLTRGWRSRRLVGSMVCASAVALVLAPSTDYARYALGLHDTQLHVRLAGHYFREALPYDAAIITSVQDTAWSHYTKRMIVRFDGFQPSDLDAVVDELMRRGHRPVLVLESDAEMAWFQAHFASSRLSTLDWPPRAVVLDRVRYWDLTDRERFSRGVRWPTDAVRPAK